MFALTILLSTTGIILSNEPTQDLLNEELITVYKLGFSHVKQVLHFAIPIVFGAYYLYGKKILLSALTLVLTYVLFTLTGNRTGFYLVVLFEIITWVELRFSISKYIRFWLPYVMPILTAATIIIALFFSDAVMGILTNRTNTWTNVINGGLIFMGDGRATSAIDSFYLHALYALGLFPFIVYAILLYTVSRRTNDSRLLLILFLLLIYGITERYSMNYYVNFALTIMLCGSLYHRSKIAYRIKK
jgi:hypothetical protein